MFERFTIAARRVITQAQDEASKLNHNYMGTEHILLGLVRDENVAPRMLADLGANAQRVRERVLGAL